MCQIIMHTPHLLKEILVITKLIYILFISSFVLLSPITPTTAHDHANPEPDYFNYITLFSDGRITRFTQMPIQVYISQTIKDSPYLPELRHAMQEWETATEKRITFQETDTSEEADIHISAGETSLITHLDTRLGSAELTRINNNTQLIFSTDTTEQKIDTKINTEQDQRSDPIDQIDFKVNIILILESDGTIDELTQKEIRAVCLHELGHALGLWGHSPYEGDINYAIVSAAQHPSQRDINTLRKLYNTPLNTPQHEISISLLKQSIESAPNHPRLHYLLGTIHFDKGDVESAIQSFQECLRLEPNHISASHKLAQAYEKTGNQNLAIDLLQNKLVRPDKRKTQLDNAIAYNHLGVLHYREGEVDKAIQAFEKALEISPHHQTTKRNLHQIYLEKTHHALKAKDFLSAEQFSKKAIQLEPQNPTIYKYLANGYSINRKFTKAIENYKKALKIQPDDMLTQKEFAICYVGYGVSLKDQKKWDEAIAAYKQARKLDPTLEIATINMAAAIWQKANAFRAEGNIDAAIESYLELKKFHPDEPDIHALLGDLYLKKGQYQLALTAFHKVHKHKPDDKQAQHNLIAVYQQYAQHLTRTKNYTTAVAQLEKAVALFPDDINLHLNLSQAYQHTSQFDKAKTHLEYILTNHPDHPQATAALFNMQLKRGNELVQQKKYTAAIEVFDSIPESKKSTNIHNMIGYLYTVQSKYLKALTAYEETLAKEPRNAVAYQNIRAIESRLKARLLKLAPPKDETTEGEDTTEEKTEDPDTPEIVAVKTKLLHTQCSLSLCLVNRGQPKNALSKYEEALKIKLDSPELQKRLIDTGRKLANAYQSRSDTQKRDKIIQLVEPLDSNFKQSLEE